MFKVPFCPKCGETLSFPNDFVVIGEDSQIVCCSECLDKEKLPVINALELGLIQEKPVYDDEVE